MTKTEALQNVANRLEHTEQSIQAVLEINNKLPDHMRAQHLQNSLEAVVILLAQIREAAQKPIVN
jgi:hypothetical protein